MQKNLEKYYFGGNREATIQRDGERCVKCGMTRDDHRAKFGRDITVDHIDGNGRHASSSERNNSLDNLQALCIPCHGKKDRARRGFVRQKKITIEDAKDIRSFAESGMSSTDIAKVYPIQASTIRHIVRGDIWKQARSF